MKMTSLTLDELMSTAEAASVLGISMVRVWGLIDAGQLVDVPSPWGRARRLTTRESVARRLAERGRGDGRANRPTFADIARRVEEHRARVAQETAVTTEMGPLKAA